MKKVNSPVLDSLNNKEELKAYIEKCEERYHKSFKLDSCKEIMDSFYELQAAKKKYYKSTGEAEPVAIESIVQNNCKENDVH